MIFLEKAGIENPEVIVVLTFGNGVSNEAI